MPHLSYSEQYDVYTSDDTEDSPQDWVLIRPSVSARVTELSTAAALQAGQLLKHDVTHRGRCAYCPEIDERPDASLLVNQLDGRQYLVLRLHRSRAVRGAEGDMTLDLCEQVPAGMNLRRT